MVDEVERLLENLRKEQQRIVKEDKYIDDIREAVPLAGALLVNACTNYLKFKGYEID